MTKQGSEPTMSMATGSIGGDRSTPRLLVFTGRLPDVHVLADDDTVVVGRGADPDVHVDDTSLSRRHARITLQDGRITVEDLGSRNGTRVRGARLEPGAVAAIDPGEVFHLGNVTCLVERPAGIRAPVAPSGSTPASSSSSSTRGPPSKASKSSAPAPGVRAPSPRAAYEALVALVGPSDLSVFIHGETGAGKEVAARALHSASARSAGPFVAINCAAMPENLLESELFGFERGAFSGADRAKPGLFESAEGGTLFLDEVADMPASVQAKLLRVLEDRQVMRLGALKPRTVDLRVLSASHRALADEVEGGRFRQDLYFRLHGIALVVPPLRDRQDELPALAATFLAAAAAKLGRPTVPRWSTEALQKLAAHPWPGNIRELKNVCERAAVLSAGHDVLGPEHVFIEAGPGAKAARPAAARTDPGEGPPSSDERERILRALEQAAGNQTRAAELLGVSRRTLVNRLVEFDIPRPRKP